MKIIITVCILILKVFTLHADEVLTLEQCLKSALENQLDLRIARHNLNINDYTYKKASSLFYPQISLSATYGYSGIDDIDPANNYSAGLSLNQHIFDFGKSQRQIKKAKAGNVSSHAWFDQTKQSIIYNVIYHYYSYLKARHVAHLNLENLNKARQHLSKARQFYEVGIKPQIEVTQAGVSLANAELSHLKARNALELAKLNLINAIGFPRTKDFDVEDRADTSPFDFSLDKCREIALSSRPDLLRQQVSLDLAEIDLKNKLHFYNLSLSARTNLNYTGSEFPLGRTWNWGAYIVFSVPLFDGLSTWYDISSAKEGLSSVKLEREKLDYSLNAELEQAYLSMKECDEAIAVSKKAAIQAQENLRLAEARYEEGIGSSIELNDARVSLLEANVHYTRSVYDYAISVANLKKAMGVMSQYIP